MNPNQQLIEEFFAAFAAHEAETMASCYHPEAHFMDPIFGKLEGKDIADMWRMLLQKSKGRLQITFSDIKADLVDGSANWTARYEFGPDKRQITNHISSRFIFRDGLIAQQRDDFDVYKWNRQAFGFKGWILGRTTLMREAVSRQAIAGLRKWQGSNDPNPDAL